MTAPYMVRRRRRHQLVLPAAFPTGLLGWESADYESAFVDGGSVSQLTNQKDGSVWGSQSTSTNQPTYRTAGINGKRAVQYQTDDYLTGGAQGAWTQNASAFTYAAVVQLTSTAGTQDMVAHSTATATAGRVGIQVASGLWSLGARRLDGDSAAVMNGAAVDTNPHSLLVSIDWAGGMGYIAVDGVEIGAALTTPGVTSNTASARQRYAADLLATPGSFLNGYKAVEASWNVLYRAANVAPMLRSWATYYGMTYAGV